jgi:hypothetical protein
MDLEISILREDNHAYQMKSFVRTVWRTAHEYNAIVSAIYGADGCGICSTRRIVSLLYPLVWIKLS